VNSLLRAPYAAAWGAARSLSRLLPLGQSKLGRVFTGREGLLERFESWGANNRDRSRKLLWMHAPSVGEGLQALPVLQLVRARNPEIQIAYTFYSPSAEQFAQSLAADFSDYLPFDTAAESERAIRALSPTAIVFSKLDIWPILTELAPTRGIRTGVISATLPAGSARSGFFGRALLGDAYRSIDAIGAISADDAARFERVGIPRSKISVTGDTRYDQVWDRARRRNELPLVASLRSERPTLVAGSTWPSDESLLLPAWKRIAASVPRARLIIAPHEINEAHILAILAWAGAGGLHASRLDSAAPDDDVIIVDRMGILGDLYALADVAYVGGGFHRAGLHSVLEPAAFGSPVLFGPQNQKSSDAAALSRAGGGFEVNESDGILNQLRRLLESESARAAAGSKARSVVESGLGAAERSYALVSRLLGGD
jgi:3-deoxy-D-manno-octulosonic-acid transferase